jgi:hypothetical protein
MHGGAANNADAPNDAIDTVAQLDHCASIGAA